MISLYENLQVPSATLTNYLNDLPDNGDLPWVAFVPPWGLVLVMAIVSLFTSLSPCSMFCHKIYFFHF